MLMECFHMSGWVEVSESYGDIFVLQKLWFIMYDDDYNNYPSHLVDILTLYSYID